MPDEPPKPQPEPLPTSTVEAAGAGIRFISTAALDRILIVFICVLVSVFVWHYLKRSDEVPALVLRVSEAREQTVNDRADRAMKDLQAFFAQREDVRMRHEAAEREKDRAVVERVANEHSHWREQVLPYLIPALKKAGLDDLIPVLKGFAPGVVQVAPMPREVSG